MFFFKSKIMEKLLKMFWMERCFVPNVLKIKSILKQFDFFSWDAFGIVVAGNKTPFTRRCSNARKSSELSQFLDGRNLE
jgi:hypothetical protein